MSNMNPFEKMLSDAVMTTSPKKGYKVHVEYRDGKVKEVGPYSKDTAVQALRDLTGSQDLKSGYLINLDTGEIEIESGTSIRMWNYELAKSLDELGDDDFYEVFQDLGKLHGRDNVEDFIEWLKDVLEEIEEAQKGR